MTLPGFSQNAPALPPPPARVVKRDDPAIAAASRKQRLSDLRRKGRASTIITGGLGVTGDVPLNRPSAQVLGA